MIRLRMMGLAVLMVAITLPALAWPRLPRLPHKAAVEDKPVRLRHLAGRIVDQRGFAIPYPAVELRSADDHHVIATTFADANGHFSFADHKPGERLEIRCWLKGYNPVQYTIELARIGHESMKAVMPVAN